MRGVMAMLIGWHRDRKEGNYAWADHSGSPVKEGDTAFVEQEHSASMGEASHPSRTGSRLPGTSVTNSFPSSTLPATTST